MDKALSFKHANLKGEIVGMKHLGDKMSTERYNLSQMLHPYSQYLEQTQPEATPARMMKAQATCGLPGLRSGLMGHAGLG